MGTLNRISSRNLLLASPGGKLPGLTALRNRQARLMRGGDRLVNDCIWMNGICFHFHHSTYYCGDFKRSPPLISLFYQPVPKCRLIKNPASPRGKPRRLRRSGRQVGDPRLPQWNGWLNGCCQKTFESVGEALSLPPAAQPPWRLLRRNIPLLLPALPKPVSDQVAHGKIGAADVHRLIGHILRNRVGMSIHFQQQRIGELRRLDVFLADGIDLLLG